MKKTEFVTIKGKAYTCTETRTGPPLRYVAEKLRRCVEGLHSLHAETSGDPRCAINLLGPFRYALISYLALHSLLGLVADQEVVGKLLRLPKEKFRRWLDSVERKGSLTILPN